MMRPLIGWTFLLLVGFLTHDNQTTTDAFQIGKVLSAFSSPPPQQQQQQRQTNTAKSELLQTISNTKNGKEATVETQVQVLRLVNIIETNYVTTSSTPTETKTLLDGLWYLQYTQPSNIQNTDKNDDDNDDNDDNNTAAEIEPWIPKPSQSDIVSKIDNKQVQNKGSVSFLGTVPVDTSNKLTTQTIDIDKKRITNFVQQDWFTVQVEGDYELDTSVQESTNRIIVSFDKCVINFNNNKINNDSNNNNSNNDDDETNKSGFKLDLSFLFAFRAALKGGVIASGWLETTFVDKDLRIGRGNRGSLFILTRDKDAVTP